MSSLPMVRLALAAALAMGLGACGGGGDGSAAALSTGEVTEVAQALGAAGTGLVDQGSKLDQQFVPPSLIPGTSGITATNREQPLAISIGANLNVNVADIFFDGTAPVEYLCTILLDEGCTGSLIIEADYSHGATAVSAGNYVIRTFNDMQGTRNGQVIRLNGRTRTDFLTDVDFTQSPANVRVRITNNEFLHHRNGVGIGPHTGVVLLEYDASGALTYTVDQVSYSGMSNIVVTDRDNFSVGTATVRRPHWSRPDTYLVYVYKSWHVVAGRPTVGSQVTISTEGLSGSSVFTVATSSPTQVTYTVRSTVGGTVKNYRVTVDYPADAAPVWTTSEVGA